MESLGDNVHKENLTRCGLVMPYGLVLSCNKPLPESILTQIDGIIRLQCSQGKFNSLWPSDAIWFGAVMQQAFT